MQLGAANGRAVTVAADPGRVAMALEQSGERRSIKSELSAGSTGHCRRVTPDQPAEAGHFAVKERHGLSVLMRTKSTFRILITGIYLRGRATSVNRFSMPCCTFRETPTTTVALGFGGLRIE